MTCSRSLADDEVLALAVEQERIVITHNVRHFAPMVRTGMESGHSHCRLILVTRPHTHYGALLGRLEAAFAAHPDQDDWVDRVAFIGRG